MMPSRCLFWLAAITLLVLSSTPVAAWSSKIDECRRHVSPTRWSRSTLVLSSVVDDDNDGVSIDVKDTTMTTIPGQDAPQTSAVLYTEDEVDSDCLPPGRSPKLIFCVSDATGVTTQAVLAKALSQFEGMCDDSYAEEEMDNNYSVCDAIVQTRSFTFIRSASALSAILETAQAKEACLMFTLADPTLRQTAYEECAKRNLPFCDLLGPSLDTLAAFLQRQPSGIPISSARRSSQTTRRLGDAYYRRIEAVEFALKADDGQSPWLLPDAEIVLVGVSRTGKTPLSVVLAQTMGLRVANVPLVLECPPPKELLKDVDPRRVFCLTLAPSALRQIRTSRLERRLKVTQTETSDNKSNYADRAYLLNDLKQARALAEQHGWTEMDVTGRAVEETASYIVELLNERFEPDEPLSAKHLA